jgi:hypothetical protein
VDFERTTFAKDEQPDGVIELGVGQKYSSQRSPPRLASRPQRFEGIDLQANVWPSAYQVPVSAGAAEG